MQRHNTVVLGASGLVAQRMQQRLANHPWFVLSAVVGSERTAGRPLSSIPWKLSEPRPNLPQVTVLSGLEKNLIEQLVELNVTVAFSCLPADVADPLELHLSKAGIAVFSNASAFRRCDGVPLVIPDVNPDHMSQFGTGGHMLACATNCTLIPLAVPVAALAATFGVEGIQMNSEQALSGGGYDLLLDDGAQKGHHSNEIVGEAHKTGAELLHVLGVAHDCGRRPEEGNKIHQRHEAFEGCSSHVAAVDLELDITCKRVTRNDGHQVFVTVTLQRPAEIEEVQSCFEEHSFPVRLQASPSAPSRSIQVVGCIDPLLHLWADGERFAQAPNPSNDLKAGMAIVLGSLEMLDLQTVRFSAYSHNTVRGAAGGTMLLAEQAYIEERLPKQQ